MFYMIRGVDFLSNAQRPGLLNSLIGLPQTEVGLVVTLVDTKFSLVYMFSAVA